MNKKKYELEMVLHSIIRDDPEMRKVNDAWMQGMLTVAEAFQYIAEFLNKEVEHD